MESFLKKEFHTIGALKTNGILYPYCVRQKLSHFATFLPKTDKTVNLVTVKRRQYYVYRYEGSLNDLEDAVVVIAYPKEVFLESGELRTFLCTDVSLSTQEILENYVKGWELELFFRQIKGKIAFSQYQIRSSQRSHRY